MAAYVRFPTNQNSLCVRMTHGRAIERISFCASKKTMNMIRLSNQHKRNSIKKLWPSFIVPQVYFDVGLLKYNKNKLYNGFIYESFFCLILVIIKCAFF